MTQSPAVGKYGPVTSCGHGEDIASQREDDLDRACLGWIETLIGTQRVVALDIGGGHGAMAVKMAEKGAWVTLVDPMDAPSLVAARPDLRDRVRHARTSVEILARADMVGLDSPEAQVDILYSQRMLHYLPYDRALAVLTRVFLSVSGADSPLGEGYAGQHLPIDAAERHAVLKNEEAAKSHITSAVTLYRESEFQGLLAAAGFHAVTTSVSAFGNIKAMAENQP